MQKKKKKASVRKDASNTKNTKKAWKRIPAGFNNKNSFKNPAGFNHKAILKKPEHRPRFNGKRRRSSQNVLREIVGNNRSRHVEKVVTQLRRTKREWPQTITIVKHKPASQRVTKRLATPNNTAKKSPVCNHKKAPNQKMTREQLDAELDDYMRSSEKNQQ
ncbi:unnamed protein product [Bursaphelenchus okinawaensis]|uniref:Chromatin target of PRMT1 protein C-terminal domain-containing protein n=1 Tax=Bursaphelenchus okinawaensis TaxID=465554 RepID=A0A811JRE7_9BILA|nr:unnamed protein product [Bursaphelenchus okinawaensis]CAG9079790.1 unnamed protein product [Bursaphelenchus okinawaensis]